MVNSFFILHLFSIFNETVPFFLQAGSMTADEKMGPWGILERGPVATDNPVKRDDGLEDAAVVMGAVPVVRVKDYVTALVTYEVFVVRRNEEVITFPEPAGAAVRGEIKLPPPPPFCVDVISKEFNSAAAVVEAKPAPPRKVLQRCGLAASEIFERQGLKRIPPVKFRLWSYFPGR